VVAQYLSEHYQPFFEAYNKLLRSSNYVTRRQSLKVQQPPPHAQCVNRRWSTRRCMAFAGGVSLWSAQRAQPLLSSAAARATRDVPCPCCSVLLSLLLCPTLQLLSELLLDVNNVRLMMRYVSDVQNLMQMMNMLKDTSRSIQYEAFHVFKV
jgi:hypothetical protein